MIVASFIPFFCRIKVIETQSADLRVSRGSVLSNSMCNPVSDEILKNLTSLTLMTEVFLGPSDGFVQEYSQDLMAKNKAPVMRLPSDIWKGSAVLP